MTDDELNQIEAYVNAATPGPWLASKNWEIGGYWVQTANQSLADFIGKPDAHFIARIRTDALALIAELRRYKRAIDYAADCEGVDYLQDMEEIEALNKS